MKVETIVSEKKFEPITFNVTVESFSELCLLWARFNPNKFVIADINKGHDELIVQILDNPDGTYIFFKKIDEVVKKLGLV